MIRTAGNTGTTKRNGQRNQSRVLRKFRGNEHKLYTLKEADVNDPEEGVHHIPAEVLRA